jgi:TetR/AcrR family transcriptional regulator, mexJK operon transcriptional repressor
MLSSNHRQGTRQSLDLRGALKKRQILDGAREVFLLKGYAGASMEEITAQAGVSKGSIYHHFDSKDALFRSLIRAEAERIARVLPAPDPTDPDPVSALRPIGIAVLEALDNPATIATLRLIVGALSRFPRLGEAFLQESLGSTVERITAYLDARTAAGALRIDSSRSLAEGFAKRCLAQAMERILMPDPPRRTEAERSARAEEVLRGLALAIPSVEGA